jgi:predicted ATPase
MTGVPGGSTVAGPGRDGPILTPDQRVRVFVSSTMEELAAERSAVRRAIEDLRLSPVLFELGARAHPPRSLYRSYLEQSHVFLGIYWQRYGWVAPGMDVSGLEDEYLLAGGKPKLIYVKRPAPAREDRLDGLLDRIRSNDDVSYKAFSTDDDLERLVAEDLAQLLSEAFLVAPEPAGPPRLSLPTDTTTFVGRTDDLAGLRALLARDDVRLVTLTGPGGIGKTRLALKLATDAAADFADGATFVPLAPLRDPELVPAAIASAVGVRDVGSEPMRDALRDDLRDRSLLLVVDNVEHLLPGAADLLSDLLEATTQMKVVVTSREALRVRAEHDYPVPSLAPADSVHLFDLRASAVRHGFAVDEANAATIAAICARLEHVPLAIELAAARARLLPPEALLERLDRRLDFLVAGARDLPERQRALRATIQWSYDLLDDDERSLFVTLGAFVGSFSLAAIEAVYARSGAPDVLELLASLVDKSLVRAEAAAGEPRFRMLEMIREFARERLDDSGETDAIDERHAAFYRDLSRALGRGVRGPEQLRWLQRLSGEGDNFRAALAWFAAHRRMDDFAEAAWGLWMPAWLTGRIDEGQRLARGALGAGAAMSDRSRARLLVIAGMFDLWKGEHLDAVPALREAVDLGRALGDDEVAAYAIIASAMVAGPLEGEDRAEELAEEGVELCRKLGDRWGEGAALNVLGWLYVARERFEGTRPVLEATASAALASGDEHLAAMAEVNLAEYSIHAGDLDAADTLLTSSARRYRALRATYSTAYMLDAAARLSGRRGDQRKATLLLGAADHLRESIGVPVWGSQLGRRQALLADLRTALGAPAFDEALAAGTRLTFLDALDAAAPTG